jgi:hypothetical protein
MSDAANLRHLARKCRRLRGATGDDHTAKVLGGMADEYDAKARELEMKAEPND